MSVRYKKLSLCIFLIVLAVLKIEIVVIMDVLYYNIREYVVGIIKLFDCAGDNVRGRKQ